MGPWRLFLRFILGIDIGWSTTRPSCGLAWEGSGEFFPGGNLEPESKIHASKFFKTALLTHLSTFAQEHPELLKNAIVVIDGPMGAAGRPTHNRPVDYLCSRGGFYRRTQAVHVTNLNTGPFLDATYEVMEALGEHASRAVWIGNTPITEESMAVVETNPTMVLAVLVPQQAPDTLPTRHRSRVWDGRTFRSKSDWYWHLGANKKVAKILGCTDVARQLDHEKVAALTCLAVAKELAGGGRARVGGDDGIYAFLREADASWEETLTHAEGQGFHFLAQP